MQDTNNVVEDLVYPEAVPFSFDTTGWKIVFTVLAICLILVVIHQVRHYQKNKYRRSAIQYLEQFIANHSGYHAVIIQECNILMKQISLRFLDRQDIAMLEKEEWINFLNSRVKKSLFNHEDVFMIEQALYQSEWEVPPSQYNHFTESTKKWINEHGF